MSIIKVDYGEVGGSSNTIENVEIPKNTSHTFITNNCVFYAGSTSYNERPGLSGGVHEGELFLGANTLGATVTYSENTLTISAGSYPLMLTIMYG